MLRTLLAAMLLCALVAAGLALGGQTAGRTRAAAEAERARLPLLAADSATGGGPASSVTFYGASAEVLTANRIAVDVRYQLDGSNDGRWSTRAHALLWCQDADGVRFGLPDGSGPRASFSEVPLEGVRGTVRLEFDIAFGVPPGAPEPAFPLTCTHFDMLTTHQIHDDYGASWVSEPIPLITTWDEGVPIVPCEPCTGW
jgi:hypothetical protein